MEDKKTQIINVATMLFAQRGFENTTVDQICSEAKVSKGLVYHHFKTKNDLLRALFSATTERMIAMSDSGESTSSPREQLVILIKGLFAQLQSDKMFFQLNLNIMLQPGTREVLNDLIKERSSHLLESVMMLFKKIDTINYEALSFMFIAELDGIALDYLTVFENYPLEKLKTLLVNKYEK